MRVYEKPPPTTDEKIAQWEAAFSVPMPQDLQTFLRESDGPVLFDEATRKELQFLSALDAIEYYDAYGFPTYCSNAIPIAMDGCGNFAVYQVEHQTIQGIYALSAGVLDWEDSAFLGRDIEALIAMPERVEERLSKA